MSDECTSAVGGISYDDAPQWSKDFSNYMASIAGNDASVCFPILASMLFEETSQEDWA